MSAAPVDGGQRYTLARPAIEVASAEVRFVQVVPSIDQAQALSLREALRTTGAEFKSMDDAARQEVVFTMSPGGGEVASNAVRGWSFVDQGAQLHVNLLPDVLLVQSNAYRRWRETFKPVLEAALGWLETSGVAQLRTRTGLRYVNRLVDTDCRAPGDWNGRIAPGLLGPLTTGPLVDRIVGAQQQLQLRNPDGSDAMLRHGPFQDPAADQAFSYLLDLDVFDTSAEAFTADSTIEALTRLNRTAATMFKDVLTPEQLDARGFHLEPEPEATA